MNQDDRKLYPAEIRQVISCENNLKRFESVDISVLKIHPDIVNLLWIAKKGKNADRIDKECTGLQTIITPLNNLARLEPSLIYPELPISFEELTESLRYARPYYKLTPQQRGKYWKYLENPYNTNTELWCPFLLYYGLERQLMSGKFDEAFNVLEKMIEVFKGTSFPRYAEDTLVFGSLLMQRSDHLDRIFSIINRWHGQIKDGVAINFSKCLYLFYTMDIPLDWADLYSMRSVFNFLNLRYIKGEPELFKKNFHAIMIEHLGKDTVLIKELVPREEVAQLRKSCIRPISNPSFDFRKTDIDIPLIDTSLSFQSFGRELFDKAHEMTKQDIAKQRHSTIRYK